MSTSTGPSSARPTSNGSSKSAHGSSGVGASTDARRVSAAPDVLEWLHGLVSIVFVLLLPLLIIGTSVRTVFTDRDFMLQGFRDNQVATTTGLDDAQLQRVADAFVAYFQAPPGQIQMQVTAFGQSRPLFNDREVAHM